LSYFNTVAVVTGGASGIGLALAQAYGARGARILIADIDEAALSATRDCLTEAGIVAYSHIADLRNAASVHALADRASELGTISAVCLNAGVTSTGMTIWETATEILDFVLDVNLRGLHNSIRSFVPPLLAQQSQADIVITASMAGMVSVANSAAYAASKAGAVALAKALRAELASLAPHLRVALLNPGMVKTNLIRTSAAQLPAEVARDSKLTDGMHQALNDFGVTPEETATWVMRALEANRFWVLPPTKDMFSVMLLAELDELRQALRE
jgi:NAD(P)-dependent dehydrogenase (short-subunit alcohol dehydrogenase family)